MSGLYRTCPECGAHLDPGEQCDCRAKEEAAPGAVTSESGRAAQSSTTKHTPILSGEGEKCKMKHWEFPINAKEFTDYQEQLSGQPFDDFELQCMSGAVETINGAYEDGKTGITTQLYPRDASEYWAEVSEQLHLPPRGHSPAKRLATALCRLCTGAWERGREDARKALLS